jgi:toxin ParE1/3/4
VSQAIWSGQALDDLANVDDFYATTHPNHADRIGRAVVQAARFLVDTPHAGPIVKHDRRKWRVPGTQYVIVYIAVSDGIEVLRVHHGRENWRAS